MRFSQTFCVIDTCLRYESYESFKPLQAVQDKYARKGAKLGVTFHVQFEKDEIVLDIPEEIEIGGWKIIPYFHPIKVSLYYATTL